VEARTTSRRISPAGDGTGTVHERARRSLARAATRPISRIHVYLELDGSRSIVLRHGALRTTAISEHDLDDEQVRDTLRTVTAAAQRAGTPVDPRAATLLGPATASASPTPVTADLRAPRPALRRAG
jgi:hypothetical protein